MNNDEKQDLLTEQQAAELLNVKRAWLRDRRLYTYGGKRIGPPHIRKGRRVFYDRAHVQTWLRVQQEERERAIEEIKTLVQAFPELVPDRVVSDFVQEVCSVQPDNEISARRFRDAYERWCRANNRRVLTQKCIGPILRQMGFQRTRRSGGIVWVGLALKNVVN